MDQLLPLAKALDLPRVNLLIADDVGLGKTIEAGLIVRELLLRRRVDMIVVAAPASMLLQWQDELAQKFGLDSTSPSLIGTTCSKRGAPAAFRRTPGALAHALSSRTAFSRTRRIWEVCAILSRLSDLARCSSWMRPITRHRRPGPHGPLKAR